MVFDLILQSLLLITKLAEFSGYSQFCFLVEGVDELTISDWQQSKDLPNNAMQFVTCEKYVIPV
jgi:hypothetical protein